MPELNLKDIVDLGMTAILLYVNRELWRRMDAITDRMFTYLEEGRQSRHENKSELTALKLKVDQMQETVKNGHKDE